MLTYRLVMFIRRNLIPRTLFWSRGSCFHLKNSHDLEEMYGTRFIVMKNLHTGTGRIYYDGYSYRPTKIMEKKGYFICCKKNSTRCRSRAIINYSTEPKQFIVTRPHNHPQDGNEKIALDFMNELKTVCKSGINLTIKEIYEDVAKSNPKGAKLKPFEMMKSTLREWKKQD